MVVLSCGPGVEQVLVLDDTLVVTGHVEGPDVVLVETVIDHWCVGIRRVGVDGLALYVVEVELGVVVFRGDDGGLADCAAVLGLEGLQALEVVVMDHAHIIDVVVEVGVLFDGLVEALEGVIEIGSIKDSVGDALETDLHSVADALVCIDAFVIVGVGGPVCAAETLVDAVLMDLPQAVDALVDVAVEVGLARHGWGNEPEKDILDLQLEHRYNRG